MVAWRWLSQLAFIIPLYCRIWRSVAIYTLIFSGERLSNFTVGITMTHPDTFPHFPNTSSVVPLFKVCYQHPGLQDYVYEMDCTQSVWGRYLVITIETQMIMNIAEVIVKLACKYISILCIWGVSRWWAIFAQFIKWYSIILLWLFSPIVNRLPLFVSMHQLSCSNFNAMIMNQFRFHTQWSAGTQHT